MSERHEAIVQETDVVHIGTYAKLCEQGVLDGPCYEGSITDPDYDRTFWIVNLGCYIDGEWRDMDEKIYE